MGLKRGLWRSTGIGRTIDTVKNIVDEGSISGGVKKMIKEDWTEDNPLGKNHTHPARKDNHSVPHQLPLCFPLSISRTGSAIHSTYLY